MKKKYYQAVYIDSKGQGFRVDGAIAESEEEAIRKAQHHSSVKHGAKLHYIDSWESDSYLINRPY